uniref:Uncharacterized protein n=1 Tax=Caenorhabditis japonica TaxID=281687 RepID=A0A8R1IR95_CAEJA
MSQQEKTIDAMRRQIVETEMKRNRDRDENCIQQDKMRYVIEQLKNQIEVYRKNCAHEHKSRRSFKSFSIKSQCVKV